MAYRRTIMATAGPGGPPVEPKRCPVPVQVLLVVTCALTMSSTGMCIKEAEHRGQIAFSK